MGDLKGHMIPGSMFILFGVWWTVCCIRRFLMCRKSHRRYTSTATFGCPWPCGKLASLPVEAFLKVLLSSAGMFGEIIGNLPHPSMGIIQHATMYFFFGISGVVDFVMHYGTVLPPGTDYLSMALAVGIEGMLFANHLHGRPMLDSHIHTLLVYVIFTLVVVIILESKFQKSAILTLCRAFLAILQGTWFWGVGIILYGHGHHSNVWDMNSHDDTMQTTIYFSWHCACIFLFMLILAGVMSCVFSRYSGPVGNGTKDMSMIPLTRTEIGDNGHYSILRVRDDEDEDDSDIEFEKPVEKQPLTS